jgi:hypothetical protein
MKAKKETKSPTPASGQGGHLTSEADEDEDLEDEEADVDDDDFGKHLSDDLLSKPTTSAHLAHGGGKHTNFSPMHAVLSSSL